MSWRRRARAAQVALAFSLPALPPDLQPAAELPDELARLEGWAAARGYELLYTTEDASRLSIARRTA